MQLVEIELLVPLLQRNKQKVQVDAVRILIDLQFRVCLDCCSHALDKVLQRDHPEALDDCEHTRLDVLVHVGRDGLLQCVHIATEARISHFYVLAELVAL